MDANYPICASFQDGHITYCSMTTVRLCRSQHGPPIEGLLHNTIIVRPYLQVIDVNLHNPPTYTIAMPGFSSQNFVGWADGSRIIENFFKIPIRIPKEFLEQTTLALVCENLGTNFSRHNFWTSCWYYYERRWWTHDAAQAWLYIL